MMTSSIAPPQPLLSSRVGPVTDEERAKYEEERNKLYQQLDEKDDEIQTHSQMAERLKQQLIEQARSSFIRSYSTRFRRRRSSSESRSTRRRSPNSKRPRRITRSITKRRKNSSLPSRRLHSTLSRRKLRSPRNRKKTTSSRLDPARFISRKRISGRDRSHELRADRPQRPSRRVARSLHKPEEACLRQHPDHAS